MTMITDGLKDAAISGGGVASAQDIAEILATQVLPSVRTGRQLPVLN